MWVSTATYGEIEHEGMFKKVVCPGCNGGKSVYGVYSSSTCEVCGGDGYILRKKETKKED